MAVTVISNKVIKLTAVSGAVSASAVPDGGLAGQVLAKASNANYDTEWSYAGGGSGVWGGITGDITNQTDLQAALADKNKTYITDTQPGLDADTGDIWFDATLNTIKFNNAGTWVSPVTDAGQY